MITTGMPIKGKAYWVVPEKQWAICVCKAEL